MSESPESTVSSGVARFVANTGELPEPVRVTIRRLLEDVTGLIFAARHTDYVAAALASAADGDCTVIGQDRNVTALDAALVNGVAAHGEDYDDTFEGGPVHAGAVIVPAVLAIAESRGLDGHRAMTAIACGVELMCRMSLVAPQGMHRAGFHPTAVIGAPAAAAAVASALGLSVRQTMHALGIAGSLSSGIIEYLADGSSTKRLHAGAAAQSGIRAALLAEAGFSGPATVFEGTHGFYRTFAPSVEPDFAPLLEGLGESWIASRIAFKPYACGTMTQPFIDCAIETALRLASRGMTLERIESIACKVGEGTVHRLWEPLALKQAPPNGYAGKFSTPYCIAVGLLDGRAGLQQFTDARVNDPRLRQLAGLVSYEIDPTNEYPRRFTGHMRVTLDDRSAFEVEQSYIRGGVEAPLSDAALSAKFSENIAFGGGDDETRTRLGSAIAAIDAGESVRSSGLA